MAIRDVGIGIETAVRLVSCLLILEIISEYEE